MKTATISALLLVLTISIAMLLLGFHRGIAPQYDPPEALVKPVMWYSVLTAVRKDLKSSWFDWDTLTKSVTVSRRERQFSTSPYEIQNQSLSASFFVIDVEDRVNSTTNEISELYVAGDLGDDPTSPQVTIEKWRFIYPSLPGPYVPLNQRPLPLVQRSVLYMGSSLGRIRSLDVDREGRFLVFVTYESPTAYRLALPTGIPTKRYDVASLPILALIGHVVLKEHITEGRMCQLINGPPWEHHFTDDRIVVLPDANNDGVFEPAQVLDGAQQHARGYDEYSTWVYPFRDN